MTDGRPRGRRQWSASVVIAAAPGTLAGVDRRLRRAGVRVVRLRTLEVRVVPPAKWVPGLLRRAPPDTVVVTSRAAVFAGVRPWRAASGPSSTRAEFWAVGPRTAAALRAAGVRPVRRPPPPASAAGIVRGLRRATPRAILYLRSDRAGPALARELRRHGHRVYDRVVYRALAPRSISGQGRGIVHGADLIVVTSPSGFDSLRRRVGPRTYARLTRSVPVLVLGARSRAAARTEGYRTIAVVPPTTPQRFTGRVLRELRVAWT